MKSVTLGRLLSISAALVLFVAPMFGQNAGQNATPPITLPATAGPAPVKSAEPAPVKSATTVSGAGGAKEVVSQPPPATSPSAGTEMLVGPGDLLKVSVLGAPEFDQELRVSSNGDAVLALIGSFHIGGLTTEQAGQLIRKKLMDGGFFSDPQVSVFEKEYATQGVSVLGEVQKPGVYPLIGPHRLFDVLSQAGGTTAKAGMQVTITHQNDQRSPQVVTMSSEPLANNEANAEVRPGDTVVVSKAGIIYVVGDVHKPSGFVMENNGMTVLQALAMAEGPNGTAALNGSKIIRRGPTGPGEVHIDLKKMLAAKAPDLKLQAEDILFIPRSAAKNAGAQTLDAIVRVATGVAVYRVP
jgi:polysaccharide biosynthesis/export protein